MTTRPSRPRSARTPGTPSDRLPGDRPPGGGPRVAHDPVDLAAALRHLRRVDGPMPALIRRHGPPALEPTRNTFASLARAIIYQQLSGKAAGTIYRRFLALFDGGRFPRPQQVADAGADRLRAAGLSAAKAASLLDLAGRYVDGTIRPRRFRWLSGPELADVLTRVRGIGPWSVDMFLMFGLCRPDVLPVGDLGVRKGFQRYFDLASLPAPAEMEALAAPWRPYRTVGSWYMWRILEEQV